MMKKFTAGAFLSALLMFTMNSQAGLIETTYNLDDVNDYSMSDALMLWDSNDSLLGSITGFDLTLTWSDQGWGNHKGRLYYQFDTSPAVNFAIASHNLVTETLSVSGLTGPNNADFSLFYVVGGGGHSLHINNASITVASQVPEPGTLALTGLGLAGLGATRRLSKAK